MAWRSWRFLALPAWLAMLASVNLGFGGIIWLSVELPMTAIDIFEIGSRAGDGQDKEDSLG